MNPTSKYVVIAKYEDTGYYALVEVFETNSQLRAELVFKALVDYWTRDLDMFQNSYEGKKHWYVVVEQPLYADPEFKWLTEYDGLGRLIKLSPTVSVRRNTMDRDLALGVD